MRTTLLRAIAGAAWAASAFAANAQVDGATSAAAACLSPAAAARSAIEYPAAALDAGRGGTVELEMEFRSPERAPTIKVVRAAAPDLDAAAARHVAQYRVPCLADGDFAVLRQSFDFAPNPGRKVTWTDVSDPAASSVAACIRHARPGSKPGYPGEGLVTANRGAPRAGVVIAELEFDSADGPPKVTFPDVGAAPRFTRAVEQWVVEYRMPCYSGQRVKANQLFRFTVGHRLDDRLLKDATLLQFLKSVRGLDEQHVFFELDRMQCPFDLRFEYRQPAGRNRLGEIGPAVPERRALLDWLAGLRFNAPTPTENLLLGQAMTISVPCGKIDL